MTVVDIGHVAQIAVVITPASALAIRGSAQRLPRCRARLAIARRAFEKWTPPPATRALYRTRAAEGNLCK